jgi:hypothetical protein
MSQTDDLVMTIDKPHFIVKLHKTLLEVDVKEGIRKELEAVVETRPILRESLGLLFQTVIPLDVRLKDIESVGLDNKGRVKVKIPMRKDIVIPLDGAESQQLIDKLNELIPPEKEKAAKKAEEEEKAEADLQEKRAFDHKEMGGGRTA